MLNIPTKADGVDTLSATEFNSLNNELKNIIESTGQTLAGGDLFQMAKSAAAYAGSGTFYIDSGTTNSYVLSAIDSFKAIDAYTDGLIIRFISTTENTGAATVNVNSLGAKSIVTSSGVSLPSGDIKLGDSITARYDVGNDNFLVQESFANVSANSGSNLIINGDFQVWQRGVSQTSDGYGSDDRFENLNGGSTKVHTQETFTLGQTDVPNNPTFYSRTVVTSVVGASNHVIKQQRLEGVAKTSGKTITLSFWAKADAAKDIAIEFAQNFGTGGPASAAIDSIGITTKALTTGWVKQTVTVAMPSITGKTLGTAGNDYMRVLIWMDAGSDFNSRTNTLGQQNGTFDIANVQIEFGTVASDFEFISPADQFAECKRYFERISGSANETAVGAGIAETTTELTAVLKYEVEKRSIPTITGSASAADFVLRRLNVNIASTFNGSFDPTTTSSYVIITRDSGTHLAGDSGILSINTGSDNFIDVDAEL